MLLRDVPILDRSRFERWTEIGYGTQGRVYSAYDNVLKRRVVIKDTLALSHERSRLLDEVTALAELQSRHTPILYGYWTELDNEEEEDSETEEEEEDEVDEEEQAYEAELYDRVYIVQELIAGRTLDRIFDTEIGYDYEEECDFAVNENEDYQQLVWCIVGQVLAAVYEFKARGWRHNDLALVNIMFNTKTRRVTIIDFGAATRAKAGEKSQAITSMISELTCLHYAPEGLRDMSPGEIEQDVFDHYEDRDIDLAPLMLSLLRLLITSAFDRSVDILSYYNDKTQELSEAGILTYCDSLYRAVRK